MTARTSAAGGDGGTSGSGHGAGEGGTFGTSVAGGGATIAARRAAFLAEERARADRPPESGGLDRTLDVPPGGPIHREKSLGTAYLPGFPRRLRCRFYSASRCLAPSDDPVAGLLHDGRPAPSAPSSH
jgi:hypothetical protein